MKLFYSTGSCSLASHIALRETGATFKLEKVDLRTKQYAGGDFLKINPKGAVPVIQLDSGEVLSEGTVILQYIADQNPEAGLAPASGSWDRYRLQEWLNFISTDIHKGFSPLFNANRLVENPEGREQLKVSARHALESKFDLLSGPLEKQEYLMGAMFTVADAYLFTVLRWSRFVGIELERWPALSRYQERILERTTVKAAMLAEGLKL